MYVKVKSMTGETCMLTVSKLTTVVDFRDLIMEKMNVKPEQQRLFYQGKQLDNEHTLYDYNIKVNDVIQLMVRQVLGESQTENLPKSPKKSNKDTDQSPEKEVKGEPEKKPKEPTVIEVESDYYKVGDKVDILDLEDTGAIFEAKLVKMTKETGPKVVRGADGITYHAQLETYEEEDALKVKIEQIRPRARHTYKFSWDDLDIGMNVMVNYNIKEPKERGFWYDAKITGMKLTKSLKSLIVTILAGSEQKPVKDCNIVFLDEVMKPEEPVKVEKIVEVNDVEMEDASEGAEKDGGTPWTKEKATGNKCDTCQDKEGRRCKDCGCKKCGGKDDPNHTILCDECDGSFHLKCLGLTSLPDDDEWFCPLCKNDDNIVGAGAKLKKKAQSKTGDSTRDWGQGFATVGRTKECSKVAKNHFGPIPGIDVGMSWNFRIQVSEEGVHRPPVAGIAGTQKEGCPSLVLAGGYEDDEDNGDEFTYTGAGGRDLSGNKRTAAQSFDQKLDRSNAAIAVNCKARFNNKEGGDAGEKWREGKPIRVCRSFKGKKHSKYAPDVGIRYDGIYKVVKYWPQKGDSGFIVWRYLMRRDDPVSSPWSKEGKKRIEEEGYECIYPEGYLEAQAEKEKEKEKSKKRKKSQDEDDESDEEKDESSSPVAKKSKSSSYKISDDLLKILKRDEKNKNLWKQIKEKPVANKKELTDYVEEIFGCTICQDIVYKPVTTPCSHNVCLECIDRSFMAEVYNCASCRADLGKDYKKVVNEQLKDALNAFFPGYEAGR